MSHLHLTELHRLYQLETQPFRKVHRMIDLFESLIKSHTVVIIAEYVKHNKLSDAAKGMLAQGLRTPSLGTWQLFSRILSEELNADGYAWTFPGFAEAFAALDKVSIRFALDMLAEVAQDRDRLWVLADYAQPEGMTLPMLIDLGD